MLKIGMHGDTNIGLVRTINEDNFRKIPARDTIVVCDGMGGHAAGEVASLTAVETVEASLLRDPAAARSRLPELLHPELPEGALELVHSVRLANRRVFLTAKSQRSMHGMGTTLVAVRFCGGQVAVCHVGDSRVYKFADGVLTPLTIDHSLLAEWKLRGEISDEDERNFPERNIITRALGTRPSVAVDVRIVPAKKNDWYVLCSDGLCGYVDDRTITKVLNQHHSDPDRAIRGLIDVANHAGGQDNVTVAIGIIEATDLPSGAAFDAQTIPETSEEAAHLEAAYLQELFPAAGLEDSRPVEPDTDKIPTLPMVNRVPERQPEDTSEKPKRGFWPWSSKDE